MWEGCFECCWLLYGGGDAVKKNIDEQKSPQIEPVKAINYLLDKNKYELWKKHDGHFNDSLNCVSAHRTTYHILHILKKYHNIDWDWIPDFIYTNHYHSSSFNFCRHLYFGHLDFNHRRGNDPMYDNMEQREILQLPENIELIKTFLL